MAEPETWLDWPESPDEDEDAGWASELVRTGELGPPEPLEPGEGRDAAADAKIWAAELKATGELS